jgi:ROK family
MAITLCVDIGATSIKAAPVTDDGVLMSAIRSLKTQAPLRPDELVKRITTLAASFEDVSRVAVGFPGGIEAGLVTDPSNLARNKDGHNEASVVEAWKQVDLNSLLSQALAQPIATANDADVAALGACDGVGLEVTITLGTGVGCGCTLDGELLIHREIHDFVNAPTIRYDGLLGTKALLAMGEQYWSQDVAQLLAKVVEIHHPDKIHLAGGNAPRLDRRVLNPWEEKVWVHREPVGILGGAALFS